MTEDPQQHAECEACAQIMDIGAGCTLANVSISGKEFARLPFGTEQYAPETFERECHDCNVVAGQLHHVVCDMEQCPACDGQLISCPCDVEDFALSR